MGAAVGAAVGAAENQNSTKQILIWITNYSQNESFHLKGEIEEC